MTSYRQYVAQELSSTFLASTASAGSSVGQLIDAAWPVTSSLVQNDLYADCFLFRPVASSVSDMVRIVASYVPAAGGLIPDAPWSVAPAAGEAYELHPVLEPKTALLACVNEALKRCMVNTELLVPTVALAQRHNVTATYPWLTDPLWVRQVGWLAPNESRDQVDPYQRVLRGQAQEYDSAIYLEHRGFAFTGNETLYIRACVRAFDQVAATGGGVRQSGLTVESDTAPCDVEWVGWGALVEAWRKYSQVLETGAKDRLLPNRQEAAQMFSAFCDQYFTAPPMTFRPMMSGGPLASHRGGIGLGGW